MCKSMQLPSSAEGGSEPSGGPICPYSSYAVLRILCGEP